MEFERESDGDNNEINGDGNDDHDDKEREKSYTNHFGKMQDPSTIHFHIIGESDKTKLDRHL